MDVYGLIGLLFLSAVFHSGAQRSDIHPRKSVRMSTPGPKWRVIGPYEFKDAFDKVGRARTAELIQNWNSGAAHTRLMLDVILAETAKILSLHYGHDYYTLDAIMYDKKDTAHFPNENQLYVEYLAVAIEHENKSPAFPEIHKLQLFNAPLKVIIDYSTRYLADYTDIVQKADVFDDFSTQRRVLLIVGERTTADVRWDYYTYHNKKFLRI
jgi:hypothetical protein